MKFSLSFKYQNVTFKNKESKDIVAYETKSTDGNTFTFDNIDEDVVIGIVKGIKNKKASEVFSFDNFRTCFINTMARNKCKELYDKLDKGEWKVEDIQISNITLKDVEFTKPTLNARETLIVESKQVQMKVYYIADRFGDPLDSLKGLESGYYLSEEDANIAIQEWMDKNDIDDFQFKIRSVWDDVNPRTDIIRVNESQLKKIDQAYLDKNDPYFQNDDELDDGMIDTRPMNKVRGIEELQVNTIDEMIDWATDAYDTMISNGKSKSDALGCIEANLVNNGYGRKWMFNHKAAMELVNGTIGDKYDSIQELKDDFSS